MKNLNKYSVITGDRSNDRGDIQAVAVFTQDATTVLEGSQCNKEMTKSVYPCTIKLRELLLATGVLIPKNGKLVFTMDYDFPSPSSASSVVMGRSSNGWTEWVGVNGATLDENIRQK